MPILNEYQKTKQVLLESYDMLNNCGPVVDKEAIPDQKNQLEKEKFIISICGAIKTGKSTFLNYMLFNGEKVLPIDVTPETAKLAMIARGQAKKAVVHFLNRREFEEYKNSPEAKSDEELAKALEKIRISDYIHDTAHSVELDDLNDLSKYISKKADLAPLVKYADIYINDKVMDKIVVVDTPGLNDPCRSRSQVTLDWVSKTDALIYLFNTKEALTRQDIDFLDQYCSHIPPEKIVLVLGQVDRADYQEVQEYVSALLGSESFSKREYLYKQNTYPVSVLAAMLKNCPENVEDLEFHRNRISPELVEKEGFMPELEEALNSSLMKAKGEDVINSHIAKIYSMLKKTNDTLDMEIELSNDKLENLGKDKDEIETKRKKLESLAREIRESRVKLEDEIERQKTSLLDNTIIAILHEKHKDAMTSYKNKCNYDWGKFQICVANAPSHFRAALKESAGFVLTHQDLEDFTGRINDLFGNTDQKLRQKIVDSHFSYTSFRQPLFSLKEIHDKIDESINEELIPDHFQDLRRKILIFFTKHPESIENLCSAIDKITSDMFRIMAGRITNHLEKDITEQVKNYFGNLTKYGEGMERNLNSYESDIKDRQNTIKQIQGEISEKQKEKQQISSIKNEISAKISIARGA